MSRKEFIEFIGNTAKKLAEKIIELRFIPSVKHSRPLTVNPFTLQYRRTSNRPKQDAHLL